MKENINITRIGQEDDYKKCGTISCLNNVYGLCNHEKCDFYENVLIQED